MLFIEDLASLPENEREMFCPRPYVSEGDISGFCVYAYLREESDEYGPKGSVRYVGEGTNERPTGPHRNVRVPSNEHIVILSDRLTKDDGLLREDILIDYFGRIITGTGVLENVRVGGRGWGVLGRRWTLPEKTCKYCGGTFKRLDLHEEVCDMNGDRGKSHNQGRQYPKEPCQFCNQMMSVSQMTLHETHCDMNPDRVPGIRKGKSFDKKSCKYCGTECSICNIDRHEKSCRLNENRVPGATKGRKYPHRQKK